MTWASCRPFDTGPCTCGRGCPLPDDTPPTEDAFLVARATCGCVEAVQLPTRDDGDIATFVDNFPHATVETVWPRVRCGEHADGAA